MAREISRRELLAGSALSAGAFLVGTKKREDNLKSGKDPKEGPKPKKK